VLAIVAVGIIAIVLYAEIQDFMVEMWPPSSDSHWQHRLYAT